MEREELEAKIYNIVEYLIYPSREYYGTINIFLNEKDKKTFQYFDVIYNDGSIKIKYSKFYHEFEYKLSELNPEQLKGLIKKLEITETYIRKTVKLNIINKLNEYINNIQFDNLEWLVNNIGFSSGGDIGLNSYSLEYDSKNSLGTMIIWLNKQTYIGTDF